ncbi:unnamed protein product [Phaedon cochleariae]|uniref:Lipase maturation factor n=1 Tax=Phaedon cochleariae TaxID=80249 RepID=A0A9P0DQL2_PHACE|nr:unnamed protein product [Phaedon cochleariae]
MITVRYTRNLFLRALCVVYLSAFLSFYIQIPGLYGDNGVLPAKSVLENSKHKTLSAKVHYQPTLLWLAPYLGLDTNYALDVLSLLGAFLAFTGLISQKFCTIPLFAGLWSLYFSLFQIGQTFVTNNYDELLLETGFLAIFVAPLLPGRKKGSKGSPTDMVTFWLVRWLLFRFLLTTNLTKFIGGDPHWWNLKALSRYFETMPLPTPLTWYAFHLPEWVLKLAMVYSNVCETALPFLFFVPIRSVRITGFFLQLFLQLTILLTGNFGFSNILLITLQLSLLDDQFFYKRKNMSRWSIVGKVANVLLHGALIYGTIQIFSLKINGSQIDSNIAITKTEFETSLGQGLRYTVYFGLISLASTLLYAFSNVLYENNNGVGSKFVAVLSTTFYAGIAVLIFFSSTVPLASLHPSSNSTIHPTVRSAYNRLHKLRAVNQYGQMFVKLPSGAGRSEIVFEGANNADGPWSEYSFLYKPGNVNLSLPFVAPHSPQLDWQMSWAARSSYDQHPWMLSFAHRLLTQKPEVLSLVDFRDSGFRQAPPKYVRALLYRYRFTQWSKRNQFGWWTREKTSEYLPVLSKDSSFLIDYLRARNLLPTPPKEKANALWKQTLDTVRYVVNHLEATLLFWSVLTAGLAVICTTASGSGTKARNKA